MGAEDHAGASAGVHSIRRTLEDLSVPSHEHGDCDGETSERWEVNIMELCDAVMVTWNKI